MNSWDYHIYINSKCICINWRYFWKRKIKTETIAIDFSNGQSSDPDAESLYSVEIVDCLVLNVLANYSRLICMSQRLFNFPFTF